MQKVYRAEDLRRYKAMKKQLGWPENDRAYRPAAGLSHANFISITFAGLISNSWGAPVSKSLGPALRVFDTQQKT